MRPTRFDALLLTCASIGVAALMMMVPAIINGTPFYFGDVANYLGLSRLLMSDDPTQTIITVYSDPAYQQAPQPLEVREDLLARAASYLGARSIFYALFLGNTVDALTPWAPAFLQCLFVSTSVWVFLRTLWGAIAHWKYLLLMLALTWTTPVAIVSSKLMPDIFIAPMMLFIVALFVAWTRLSWTRRLWLAAGVFVPLLVHISHPPVAFAMTIAGFVLMWAVSRDMRAPLQAAALLVATLGAATIVKSAGDAMTTTHLGVKLERPPFMLSRVLEDGPGLHYLRDECADSDFEICKYADRILAVDPFTAGEFTLWDITDPDESVYQVIDVESRARMREQAMDFAIAAIAREPMLQVVESAKNFAAQLLSFKFEGTGTTLSWKYEFWEGRYGWIGNNERLKWVPQDCIDHPSQRCGRFYHWLLTPPSALTACLSLALFAFVAYGFVVAHGWRPSKLGGAEIAIILVLCAILANAFVCGVFAGPFDRYQSRIIWLLPLIATSIAIWSPDKVVAPVRALRPPRRPAP